MADEVIGRADYELRAKIDGLKKDIAAAESELAASGKRTEADYTAQSKKWGPAIAAGVTTGVKVVAAGATAMFAVALKGAADLQQVQNDYQAETGASAEEAKRAGQVINKIAGENQQSLASVSAAAIAVHNDLGLVGDQADKVLAQMTKFARVTKQEPVAAVKAFDDILDAWNLTADDSQKVMDALVLSHQKYGGAVSDDQAALAALAPTLRAMNGTWEDAVALLDLAKASGLSTSDAIAGLNKALGKVKSPEELQRLIDDISNTADPFLRAQKAADLFGQKAGPKLANALAGKSLKDFRIDMNEAAGATDKAADALDQGFGAQARKKLSEWGATLRGLGADWGPLLTAAGGFGSLLGAVGVDTLVAKLGPKAIAAFKEVGTQGGQALVDAAGTATGALGTIIGNNISNRIENIVAPGTETVLGKAWKRVAGSRAVLAAAGVAGAVSGAAYGAATAVGSKIADLLAPIWGPIAAKLRPVILAAGLQSGITFGVASAEGAAGAQTIAGFSTAGTTAGKAFGVAAGIAAVAGVAAIADQLDPSIDKLGSDIGQKIRDTLNIHIPGFSGIDIGGPNDWPWPLGNKGAPDWAKFKQDAKTGAEDVGAGAAEGLAGGFERERPTFVSVMRDVPKLFGQATRDGWAAEAPRTAASIGNTLAAEFKSHGGAWIASAHKAGERAMEGVAHGIFDARQKVVDAFDTLKELLKHPLGTLKEEARLAGELTGKLLARGLHSNDEGIRDFSRSTKQYALDQLTALAAKSGHIGAKASAAIEAGLKSKNATIRKNSADAKLAYLAGLQQYVERGGKLSRDAAAAVERGIKSKNSQIHKAALHIKELATAPLAAAKAPAYNDGANISKQFASGLIDPAAMARIRDNAATAANAAADFLHGHSPPKKGPLSTIDEGGANVTKAWAKGLASGIGYVHRAVGTLASVPMPMLAGGAFPVTTGTAATGGGGLTINGGLHLHGVGSDVSPAAAERFGKAVLREVSAGFQQGSARRGLSVAVRP